MIASPSRAVLRHLAGKWAGPPRTAVNVTTLVGNLTADPVTNQLGDVRKVCNRRIAVNDVKDADVSSTSRPSGPRPTPARRTSPRGVRSR